MKTEHEEGNRYRILRIGINLENEEDVAKLENGEIEKQVDEFAAKCSNFDRSKDSLEVYCTLRVEDFSKYRKWDCNFVLWHAKDEKLKWLYRDNKTQWGDESSKFDVYCIAHPTSLKSMFKVMRKGLRDCIEFYKKELKKEHTKLEKEFKSVQSSLNKTCDDMHGMYNLEETWRKSNFSVS